MSYEQEIIKEEAEASEKNSGSFFSELFSAFVKSMIFLVVLLCLFIKICTVSGDSMLNTLTNGEKLIISNLFYSPAEGDIVVFHDTDNLNEFVVKRIIATGDTWIRIDFDRAEVYLSKDSVFEKSEIIDESGYAYLDIGRYKMKGYMDIYVPEGYLFVMGDNRNNSLDSRSPEIGLVDERSIVGKVLLRFFPFNKIGTVN